MSISKVSYLLKSFFPFPNDKHSSNLEFEPPELSQIKQIDQLIGLSKQSFDAYFLETITRFKCIIGNIPDQLNNQTVFFTTLNHYIKCLKSQKQQPETQDRMLRHYVSLIVILTDQLDQILQHYHLYYLDGNQDIRWNPEQLYSHERLNISRYETISRPSSPSPFIRFFIFNTLIHKEGLKWISSYSESTLELKQFLIGNNQENGLLVSTSEIDNPSVPNSIDPIGINNDCLNNSNMSKNKDNLFIKNNLLDEFISWLSFNIDNKIIVINRPDSRIHVVNEGLFLAAPGIFQDYEKDMQIPWKKVQNKLLGKRWHQRGPHNTNFLTYKVKGKICQKHRVNGVVINNPIFLNNPLPSPNQHLQLITLK